MLPCSVQSSECWSSLLSQSLALSTIQKMKDRGKAVEISDSMPSEPPCRRHPSSSSVGICALCLKDRLIKLVCSDCGEPRLSSCSCSDISSHRNSAVDLGSVGPISFLIQSDTSQIQTPRTAHFNLKRSSSTCLGETKNSFWHLGLFSKKRTEKGVEILGRHSVGCDQKCKIWDFDHLGPSGSFSFDVRRSSSLRSCESETSFATKKFNFFELEDEKESEFFDLKVGETGHENDKIEGILGRGSSCRITVNEPGMKGGKRGLKVWKWIFRQSHRKHSKK